MACSGKTKGFCDEYDEIGWGTALLTGKSQVRFQVAALEFVIDKSFRPHYGPGVDSALTETSARNIFGGGGMRACKDDRWVGLTAYSLHVQPVLKLDTQPLGTLRAFPGLHSIATPILTGTFLFS